MRLLVAHVAVASGLPQCRRYLVVLCQRVRHSGALAIFEHCRGVGVAFDAFVAVALSVCCGHSCNGTVQFVIYFVVFFRKFFYFSCVYEGSALKKWNETWVGTYWKTVVGKNRLLAATFRSSTCCINCAHLKAVGVKALANGFISWKRKWRVWRWFLYNRTVNILCA